jgi:hypothetical protein
VRPLPGDKVLPQVEEHAGVPGGDAPDPGAVTGNEGVLERRTACEVVRAIRGIVGEASEFLAGALKLDLKGVIGPRALILKRIPIEDVDRRDDRNYTDDEDADQQLEQRSPRDRSLDKAAPAA